MRIYLAGPFFNAAQRNIIDTIEDLCAKEGHQFYSPRLHSGSDKFTPEDRKSYDKWTPIIQSNVQQLYSCDMVVAVLEYAMPAGVALMPVMRTKVSDHPGPFVQRWDVCKNEKPVELPDNGTVWECAGAYFLGKPTYGFHSTKQASEMNLMLSHTMNGMITGFSTLWEFLSDIKDFNVPPQSHPKAVRFSGEVI